MWVDPGSFSERIQLARRPPSRGSYIGSLSAEIERADVTADRISKTIALGVGGATLREASAELRDWGEVETKPGPTSCGSGFSRQLLSELGDARHRRPTFRPGVARVSRKETPSMADQLRKNVLDPDFSPCPISPRQAHRGVKKSRRPLHPRPLAPTRVRPPQERNRPSKTWEVGLR